MAGAIGAAALYGGTPARAQPEVNTEIQWSLERWGVDLPEYVANIPNFNERHICLVDHNQFSQTPKEVSQSQIVGVTQIFFQQRSTICCS